MKKSKFIKKKQHERKEKRKEFISKMIKLAFIRARGKFKNFQWQYKMRCYHEDYTNCLLEFFEDINESECRVFVVASPKEMVLPSGRLLRIKKRELVTLTEFESQLSELLNLNNYGQEEYNYYLNLWADNYQENFRNIDTKTENHNI